MPAKVMCFVFDGTGLGHLRRVATVAGELARRFSVLVVSGMRETAWIVPKECEVAVLPPLTKLLPSGAAIEGMRAQTQCDEVSIRMRRQLLRALTTNFRPDAFLTDYLPFGRRGELYPLLEDGGFRKYFIHRGVVDTSDFEVLGSKGMDEMEAYYDRIFIATDPAFIDVIERDKWSDRVKEKALYAGLVALPLNGRAHSNCSDTASGPRFSRTAICSGGGGWHGERLAVAAAHLAAKHPSWEIEIVLGGMSALRPHQLPPSRNCVVRQEDQDLDRKHANADIVICHGGYNSLMESMIGGARIVVFPSRAGEDDEQRMNAQLLGAHYPIELLTDLNDLESRFQKVVDQVEGSERPGFPFNADGATYIRRFIERDIGAETSA